MQNQIRGLKIEKVTKTPHSCESEEEEWGIESYFGHLVCTDCDTRLDVK